MTDKQYREFISSLNLDLDDVKRKLAELGWKLENGRYVHSETPSPFPKTYATEITISALTDFQARHGDDDKLIADLTYATHVESDWQTALPERDRQELSFAIDYAQNYAHGTAGHNRLMLIEKLHRIIEAQSWAIARLERAWTLEMGGRDG